MDYILRQYAVLILFDNKLPPRVNCYKENRDGKQNIKQIIAIWQLSKISTTQGIGIANNSRENDK